MNATDASDALVNQVRHCSWLICEDEPRFVDIAFRFAPEMTPLGSVASIRSTTLVNCRESVESLIRLNEPSVLLWHLQGEDVLAVLDQVIWLANHSDSVLGRSSVLGRRILPIVACDHLGRAGELAMAEAGVSVFLRHPEDLPKYGPLIQAHFASFAGGLK